MKKKYALVKVAPNGVAGPRCELMEIYTTEDPWTYDGCEPASLHSVEDLRNALADIEIDGLNFEFWENGWLP
tara:strand:+ start:1395 stop:1610 length:216 start_codon:yes stop_codon:yes gene_type:complete